MADRESRKKQLKSKRQEQILKAATDVFVRKGYKEATIPEIAKSCGLAAGTIYIYYPGKRELFTAVIENLIVTPLAEILAKKVDTDFPSTLKEALKDRMDLLKGDTMPRLLALMGEIQRDDELLLILAEKLVKPFLKQMETMYSSRVDAGEFRELQPEIVVRLIGSIMIGMTLLKNIERDTSPLYRLPQEKIADEIWNFMLYGLMKTRSKNAK